ncbi:MAG: membrane protein insertase YidC [Ignavibacteria bacterium]|jgi:YidC/Oxa1 family membrane protein insertase
MDKQTTLAFILIGVILVVWLYINSPEPQPEQKQTADTTQVSKPEPADVSTEIQEQAPEELEEDIREDENSFVSNKKERIITIDTELAKIEMTSKGARIRKYYLKEYETWYYRSIKDTSNFYDRHVQLLNPQDGGDFNIVFVTKQGEYVNTAKVDFESDLKNYHYKVDAEDSLQISYAYTNELNQSIRKIFTFYGDKYASKIDVELENMHDVISSYRYDIEWSNGINFVEQNSEDEAKYASASVYSGEEQIILDAPGDGEKESKEFNGKIDWIGVKNKYFAVIVSPDVPSDRGGAILEGRTVMHPQYGKREYYSASLKVPFNDTHFQKNTYNLYIGPIDYDLLKSYGRNYEALFDFGSFLGLKFIIRPISEYILLPLFKFLHTFIPNYGFVIIVFSLIIKFALYPLTKQSYKSMKRMQQLQPKIAEIKEKYKEDQQRVQKETMKLYSTYGINPMGGCLPMLLQMPILIALWSLFNVAIDIRHEPFMFWITNLSAPDVIYDIGFKIPLFGIDKITGLAPLLGITMFFQQKMTMKDPSQKAMVYMMPIMFTFMFMGFPSGLNLYYFMFNLFSIVQQNLINRSKSDGELVPVKNPKKKGGFMQRMMDAAEKQQKLQKDAQKKPKKKKF